jgi:hypothetical protein
MKLSLVLLTQNVGLRTNLNILHTCTLGTDDVEVMVCDTSGDIEKQTFLSQIHERNCRVFSIGEDSDRETFDLLLDEATSDCVFLCADNGHVNGHSIAPILKELDRIGSDPAIVGTTGDFVIDDDEKTTVSAFQGFDEPTALERFRNFLGAGQQNIFQYSPIRRSILKEVSSFRLSLPIYLPYHSWLINSLLLMHGRITYIKRFLYQQYDSNSATSVLGLEADAQSFQQAGLDSSSARLQWLIAAFEGAQTFMNKYQRVQLAPDQRQALGAYWFEYWFPLFLQTVSRQPEDAKFDLQAQQIAEKWRTRQSVNLPELLTDIAEFYALSSPEISQRYYNFWR